MREILFRGKRVDNSEWILGFLRWYREVEKYFIEKSIETRDYEIRPETIGQFTGLADKNGKKIFEGDIVKVKHNNEILTGKIEYLFDRFVVVVGLWSGNLMHYATTINLFCEVIGNIYDNPELLEV